MLFLFCHLIDFARPAAVGELDIKGDDEVGGGREKGRLLWINHLSINRYIQDCCYLSLLRHILFLMLTLISGSSSLITSISGSDSFFKIGDEWKKTRRKRVMSKAPSIFHRSTVHLHKIVQLLPLCLLCSLLFSL